MFELMFVGISVFIVDCFLCIYGFYRDSADTFYCQLFIKFKPVLRFVCNVINHNFGFVVLFVIEYNLHNYYDSFSGLKREKCYVENACRLFYSRRIHGRSIIR
jgi:hypothetical protein